MSGEPRPRRPSRRIALITLSGALGVIAALTLIAVAFQEPIREGYAITAQTMIPLEVNPTESTSCPAAGSSSPLAYQPDGALAQEVELYEGEILATRLEVAPFGGPMPRQVEFAASWPTTVVTESSPVCVFVVGDGGSPSQSGPSVVEWTSTGAATVEFSVENALLYTPTVIEVWLEAIDLPSASTFRTSLSIDDAGDQFVVDPIGGQIRAERRPGIAGGVALETPTVELSADAEIPVRVSVSNPADVDWVFDARLVVTSNSTDTKLLPEATPNDVICSGGAVLTCEIGDVAPGEGLTIDLAALVDASTLPDRTQCGTDVQQAGLCIDAELISTTGGLNVAGDDSLFLAKVPESTGDLSVNSEPTVVYRRTGERPTVAILLTNTTDVDISNVAVTGSDCDQIERTGSELDDNDAFLTPGEQWRFACLLPPEWSGDFRVDFRGSDPDGTTRTGTYVSSVRLVDPMVTVTASESDDGIEFTVTNSGTGELFELALRIPGCARQEFEALDDGLDEGDSVIATCVEGDPEVDAVVVFGTDAGGVAFVSRAAP